LPVGVWYTDSHFWLQEVESGVWRVGFTQYAIRLLGDMVEYEIGVKPGELVQVDQEIGSIEGFKAIAGLYCLVDGVFVESNPLLAKSVELVDLEPYERGWLYAVRGAPAAVMDVAGYVALLDRTIQGIIGSALKDQRANE